MPISDPDKLSRKPSQIRTRLQRGAGHLDRDLAMLEEVAGFKPVSEWDDAEIAHGRPRDKNGQFRGRPPKWVTPKVVEEARRRWKDRTHGAMLQQLGISMRVINEAMTDPSLDMKTRLDAAKFVWEQGHGKAAMKLDVEHTHSIKDFLASALVLDDGQGGYTPAHPVIDGQFRDGDETALDEELPDDDELSEEEEEEDLRPVRHHQPHTIYEEDLPPRNQRKR